MDNRKYTQFCSPGEAGPEIPAAFSRLRADAPTELRHWFVVAAGASWTSLTDVPGVFPDVDQIGRVLIFNIRRGMIQVDLLPVPGCSKGALLDIISGR